ncbi:MAG: DUF4279 domain-containing protein [Janthinobacterium lividum]
MDKAELIATATAEIANPNLGVTKQVLKIHSVVYKDGLPVVAGVALDYANELGIVHFAVEKEKFYLAISISTSKPEFQLEPQWAWVQEWNRISFQATSETLDSQQLSALTTLTPTDSWNKGDQRKFGGAKYEYSSVEFMPYLEPGEFELMLKKLLTFLEQDTEGIRSLVDKAEGYVRIISVFHNGNTMLGGLHLDKECIKRLAALNLEIDFDLYAEGKLYK